MKTKFYLLTGLFICSVNTINAQVTESTNTVTSSNSYVGTSNDFDVLFKRYGSDAGLLSPTTTTFGVNSFASIGGVSIGTGAGQNFSTGITGNASNTFVGWGSGAGFNSLNPSTGYGNSYFGSGAGSNSNCFSCTAIGTGAGATTNSTNGTFLGAGAGVQSTGYNNILIGVATGYNLTGSSNIMIGGNTNPSPVAYENKLIIENGWDDYAPLIWGDFEENQLKFNGKVGIGFEFGSYPTVAGGVDVSSYNLFVRGGILTEAVRVNLEAGWADYVFAKDYNLKPLSEVEKFINDNGHLPNVPSATKVKEDGIELGEMAKIQQEKIEELTLYIIELNKKLEAQDKKIEMLMQTKQ